MKVLLIVIGILISLGGLNAIRNPHAWTQYPTAGRYGNKEPREMSKESSKIYGYSALGLGIIFVIGGALFKNAQTKSNRGR